MIAVRDDDAVVERALERRRGGLPKASVVVVSQISAIEKALLRDRIGALSSERVEQIVAGLGLQQRSFF